MGGQRNKYDALTICDYDSLYEIAENISDISNTLRCDVVLYGCNSEYAVIEYLLSEWFDFENIDYPTEGVFKDGSVLIVRPNKTMCILHEDIENGKHFYDVSGHRFLDIVWMFDQNNCSQEGIDKLLDNGSTVVLFGYESDLYNKIFSCNDTHMFNPIDYAKQCRCIFT